MTRVRLRCPQCRLTTTLEAYEIILRIGPEHTAGVRFICPTCEARNDVPAHPRAVDQLTAAGVSILNVDELGDLEEEEPSTIDEPIHARDVFDFIYALAITDTPQAELLSR